VGGVQMVVEMQLKTGYGKTKPYYLYIDKRQLELLPFKANTDTIIQIPDYCISHVVIIGNMPPEIEIRTENDVFYGFLNSVTDMNALLIQFRKKTNSRILCMYFGGSIM
jgi:hypothetical protein